MPLVKTARKQEEEEGCRAILVEGKKGGLRKNTTYGSVLLWHGRY